jgi:uncharacterized damage-inducible protein DinB
MKLVDLFPYWLESNDLLLRAIAGLSAQDLEWVPPGGRNSIGWLASHIALLYNRDIRQRLLGEPRMLPEPWQPATAREITAALAELHSSLQAYLRAAGPETLRETRTAAGMRPAPVRELLWNVLIEELHHRGQIFMLLRMRGLEPPGI